jgi:hypothetical protein
VIPVTCSEAGETEAGATFDLVPTRKISSPQVEVISQAGGGYLGARKSEGGTRHSKTLSVPGSLPRERRGCLLRGNIPFRYSVVDWRTLGALPKQHTIFEFLRGPSKV